MPLKPQPQNLSHLEKQCHELPHAVGALWSCMGSLTIIVAVFGVPMKPCMQNTLFMWHLHDLRAMRRTSPPPIPSRVKCHDPLTFITPNAPNDSMTNTTPTPPSNGAAHSTARSAAPDPVQAP